MTGTGTQTDPYVVDNWNDFVQAAAIENAYVKFADGGGTVNMSGKYFNKNMETVEIKSFVDGNGWKIKNLYVIDQSAFNLSGKVYNLNFVDFRVNCSYYHARLINFVQSGDLYGAVEQCQFTGTISGKTYDGTYYAAMISGSSNDTERISVSKCSFNLKVTGGISINGGNKVICSECIFNVDSSENSTPYPFYDMHFKNCLITGKYQNLILSAYYSKHVLLDVECPKVSGMSGISKTEFFIGNADRSRYDPTKFYAVTTEQLKDAKYLSSIGLPIDLNNTANEDMWIMGTDYPIPSMCVDAVDFGAFANAGNLVEVSIPRSVKKIGRQSFKNTKLKSVMIASDCTYYPTSFPQGCTINFYPD